MAEYELGEELWRGSMHVAHAAHDADTDTDVVVVDLDTSSIEEAKRGEVTSGLSSATDALKRVESENVTRLLDTSSDNDNLRIVFEHVEGETLASVLAEGKLPVEAAVAVGTQLLSGVEALAAAGLMAPVLNPDTVILAADGTAKILGMFALPWLYGATALPGDRVLPTMAYLAPEQINGEPGGPAASVWSTGVILYRLLSGHNPFETSQVPATAYRIEWEKVPPLAEVDVPGAGFVSAIVAKAMAKKTESRYQSAAEMRADIEQGHAPEFVEEQVAPAGAATAPIAAAAAVPVTKRPLPIKWIAIAVLAIVLVAGAAFGANTYNQRKLADERARKAAALSEARAMAAHVSRLKTVRNEFGQYISMMDSLAQSNRTALARWDTEWSKRQANYNARVAEVKAHNAAERAADEAGFTTYSSTDFWGYTYTYQQDTYTPHYWNMPKAPSRPGKVTVSVTAAQAKLAAISADLAALEAEIASSTPTSRYFGPVYQRLADAAVGLKTLVSGAQESMGRSTREVANKGTSLDVAGIDAQSPTKVDDAFSKLDTQVTTSLQINALTVRDVVQAAGATATTTPTK